MVDFPVLLGHSLGFRWNQAENFGAVSTGATLTDRCFHGLCYSFRRAGLPVHEVTPAALSSKALGMRSNPFQGVCGHTGKFIFRLRSALCISVDVSEAGSFR